MDELPSRPSRPARPSRVPPRRPSAPLLRAGGLLALLAALAGSGAACASRQVPTTVPRQGTLDAVHARRDWIDERLRAWRAAESVGDDAGARSIGRELEQAGVDWRSFLTPIRGSVRGSCCILGEWPKNHTLRQIAQKLNLVRDVRQIFGIPDRANDLARDGTVLDSAFFTNTDVGSLTREDVLAEAAGQAPSGTIYVTSVEKEGVSEGFWGRDEKGDVFIFVLDPPGFDEMNTAAEVMGSTILRVAGYYVPYPTIVTLDRLEVAPEVLDEESEDEQEERLEQALGGDQQEIGAEEDAAEDEDRIGPEEIRRFVGRRAVATKAITDGYRGPWTYWVFRERRELRGAQVFAAWINNYDQVDHNTIAHLYDEDAGLVRYYIVDTSSAFGSASNRVKEPAAGYVNNSIDVHRLVTGPLRGLASPFGYRDPWDPDQPVVSPAVGRFDADLEPRLWKPQYPNLAYEDMDEEDAEWAARLIGRFSDDLIDAVVSLARYSNPADAAHVASALKARRDTIVRTYLEED